jgi:photosystem II stability/assembly factor-like uncharacterized protein
VIDIASPSTLYAGGVDGVFKTTNAGQTWVALGTGLLSSVRSLAIDPQDSAVVFAGTEGGGLYRTTDGGTAWEQVGAK